MNDWDPVKSQALLLVCLFSLCFLRTLCHICCISSLKMFCIKVQMERKGPVPCIALKKDFTWCIFFKKLKPLTSDPRLKHIIVPKLAAGEKEGWVVCVCVRACKVGPAAPTFESLKTYLPISSNQLTGIHPVRLPVHTSTAHYPQFLPFESSDWNSGSPKKQNKILWKPTFQPQPSRGSILVCNPKDGFTAIYFCCNSFSTSPLPNCPTCSETTR